MKKTEGRNGEKDAPEGWMHREDGCTGRMDAPGGWMHRKDGCTGRMDAPGGCAGMVAATMDWPDGQEAWTGWKDTIDGG